MQDYVFTVTISAQKELHVAANDWIEAELKADIITSRGPITCSQIDIFDVDIQRSRVLPMKTKAANKKDKTEETE